MILVNNPGSWGHIFAPLKHAPWHGLTPTDLVFPFFLFAVGLAMSFVMPRLEAAGPAVFWKKVIKRTLIIFAIGLFLNWWPFVRWVDGELTFINWINDEKTRGVRIFGVLQRIAVCYFFASVIVYYLKARLSFYISLLLLLLYWLICYLGNPSDPYSLQGWVGTGIDKEVLGLGHIYKGEKIPFDPEGLLSTIPAIVQVIFGYLIGDFIQKRTRTAQEMQGLARPAGDITLIHQMLTGLFVAGVAFLLAGFCWDTVFPINKKIWTSSYTVYTVGLATITIATMIYFIEVKGVRGWLARFFDVFGKNALFVFALSAFLPKGLALIRIPDGLNKKGVTTYLNPWYWPYKKLLVNIPGPPEIGSLAFAICVILFMWLICWWMDRRGIYVKV
jgi:predicted acyltransferase